MFGGKMRSERWKHKGIQLVLQRKWMQKTPYLFYIPQALLANLKEWCIPLPVTWSTQAIPLPTLSSTNLVKFIFVPLTSGGLPDTVISFTAHFHKVQPH